MMERMFDSVGKSYRGEDGYVGCKVAIELTSKSDHQAVNNPSDHCQKLPDPLR